VRYLDTFVNVGDPPLFERQMFEAFSDLLGLSREENGRAVREGYRALERFRDDQRAAGRETLRRLEAEDRLGIVMLGRPYHNDPGINQGILEEFQKLGYPIFTQDALPVDDDVLERLYRDEYDAYVEEHGHPPLRAETGEPLTVAEFAMDISDVWKTSYSENTSRKIWAAKFAARHPNLVALELSSFKCGHDAPIYGVIEEIVERSGTPCFAFKDIDENKPAGSIRIRVETIDYFLKRYREEMIRRREERAKVEAELAAYEARLREDPGRKGGRRASGVVEAAVR